MQLQQLAQRTGNALDRAGFQGGRSLDAELPLSETCFFVFIGLLMLSLLILMAVVLGTTGKDVTPEKKRSLRYAFSSLFILIVGFVGFVPGSALAVLTGSWYADAFKLEKRPSVVEAEEQFGIRWAWLLGFHIFFALGWNILAPIQAVTGALSKAGDFWRKWHQRAGYAVMALGVFGILVGAALELHKRLDGPRGEGILPFVSVMETGAMVIANTVAGIYYVKNQDIESHKAAMAWAVAWSTDAGGLRLCSYIASRLIGDISAFDDRVVSSATVMFSSLRLAIMLPSAAAAGDISWNFLLLNFVLLELRLVSAISCWLSLAVGLQAAAVGFVLLAIGAYVGTRSLCSHPLDAGSPDASAGPEQNIELISNPVIMAWFSMLLQRPQRSSLGLLLLVLTTLGISNQYTTLKNEPLDLEPMDTKLMDVQKTLQEQYAWAPRSKMDIDVLFWGTGSSLDDLAASVKDVARGLSLTEDSCKTLKWGQAVPTQSSDTLVHRFTLQVTPSAITTPNKCLAALRESLASLNGLHGLHVSMASANAVIDASLAHSDKEASQHLVFSAPAMICLLVLGVGSIPRALTPFLCLFASILGVRAAMVLVKIVWRDFNFSNPDTPLTFILLALCFDYSLFFWSRFSQERRQHPAQGYPEAILCSLRTSGFVILLSSGILLVNFLIGSVYPDHNKTGYLGTSFQLTAGVFFVGFYSLSLPAVLAVQMPSLFDEHNGGESWCTAALPKWLTRPDWMRNCSRFITSRPWVFLVPLAICACFLPLLIVLSGADMSFDRYEAYASQAVPEFAANRLLEENTEVSSFTEALVLMEAVPLDSTFQFGDEPSQVTLREGFGKSVCSLIQSAIWRSSARRQSRYSRNTWRIATACSHPAQTTAATGSSARGVRMSLPRGAWITTTSTRSRHSMWPPMALAKQTGPRE